MNYKNVLEEAICQHFPGLVILRIPGTWHHAVVMPETCMMQLRLISAPRNLCRLASCEAVGLQD